MIGAGIVLVHALLYQPQTEDPGIERDVFLRGPCNCGDVMKPLNVVHIKLASADVTWDAHRNKLVLSSKMKRFLLPLVLVALAIEAVPAQSTIFLVRHAERADTAGGGEQNAAADPELSATGRARAESLTKVLKDARIASVFATEFKRTQQTAEGPAKAAGVSVTIVPAKDSAELVTKLRKTRGNALVVGHSNSLPEIVRALGVAEAIMVGESDYDNLFVFVPGSPPHLLRLHY